MWRKNSTASKIEKYLVTGDEVSGDEICRCNKIGETDSCGAAGGNSSGGKPVREHQTFLLKVFVLFFKLLIYLFLNITPLFL